ncbi:MAG TPA: YXWGXW repeat-containing protein [Methylocella sp.]|nr:YXWGXW repeat-containing protein [Methylocella sp.]
MFRLTPRSKASSLAFAGLLACFCAWPAAAQVAVVERPMPAPLVEVVPAAPRAGYAWVPGHWVWRRGAWFWVRGHYARGVVPAMPAPIAEVAPMAPAPGYVWVRGYWRWWNGRWVWNRGMWIRR